MKSSKIVKLTLLSSLALGIAGCKDTREAQRCVDQNSQVVDEQGCEIADQQRAQYNGIPPNPIPYWWYYHWIFGGSGGYSRGSIVFGGRLIPTPGYSSVRGSVIQRNGGTMPSRFSSSSSEVSRGGFGSTGAGHGGSGE